MPKPMLGTLKHHLKPFQKPHPPIGIAGFSPGSDTLKLAGERGFIPLSLNLRPSYVATHWDAVDGGASVPAARRTGAIGAWCARFSSRIPMRKRIRRCVHGGMGRMMREYLLPLFQ